MREEGGGRRNDGGRNDGGGRWSLPSRQRVAAPLLRARQVDMDIPLLAYFRTERAVPQPFAWHSGTENWTAPALVEWAETVCALHRTLPVDTTVAEQLTGRGDREL